MNRIMRGLRLLGLLCMPLLVLQGQSDSTAFRAETLVGLQYGMSWNQVNFSPRIKQTNLIANRLGAAMRYTAEPHLGIQLEFAYDQRGWAEVVDTLSSNYTREIDYFELAAFSHISIGSGLIRPTILLGSYLSYPLSQTETIPADWTPNRSYYGEMLPERLQYGLAGGLGLEVVFGAFSIQLDGRFRSALGGLYPSTDSRFTFSNSQGITAQATVFVRLFGSNPTIKTDDDNQ